MRFGLTTLFAVALLVPLAGATEIEPLDATFASPVEWTGDTDLHAVDGDLWTVVQGPAHLELQILAPTTMTSWHEHRGNVDGAENIALGPAVQPIPDETLVAGATVRLDLAAGEVGWVQAQGAATVAGSEGVGRGVRSTKGVTVTDGGPPNTHSPEPFQWRHDGVGWISTRPQTTSMSLDPAFLSLQGFTITCAPACQQDRDSADSLSAGPVSTWDHVRTTLTGSMSGTWNATTEYWVLEFDRGDVQVDGELGLPRFSSPACRPTDCNGDHTLFLTGQSRLGSLGPHEDSLGATLWTDDDSIRLGESRMSTGMLFGTAAASAATMALLLGLAAKLGWFGLFTRLPAKKALEHPNRKTLYQYIQENPGATFRELVRETGIAAGTSRHHLNVLRRSELVVEKPHKATLRFFENHGKFDRSWDTVVMLRESSLAELHQWLLAHPAAPQKSIIEAMAAEGWSRGTAQHRLNRLVDAGLITVRPQGRLKLYTAHPEPSRTPTERAWNGLDASWPNPSYS